MPSEGTGGNPMSSKTQMQEQQEEQQIHTIFSPMGLEEVIKNQRQINGGLCRAIWHLIDALDSPQLDHKKLAQLRSDVERVAGAFPPGCSPRDAGT